MLSVASRQKILGNSIRRVQEIYLNIFNILNKLVPAQGVENCFTDPFAGLRMQNVDSAR